MAIAVRELSASPAAPQVSLRLVASPQRGGQGSAKAAIQVPRSVYLRRRALALAALAMVVTAVVAPLRSEASAAFVPEPAVVVVGAGDTLWNLAWPYVPAGEDLRNYVARVAAENDVAPGALRPGMVLRFPQS